MKRSFVLQLFGFVCVLSLLLGATGLQPVRAQSDSQADLVLADLGMTMPQILTGPISETTLSFNLPPNWKPEGAATLDLDLNVFISSLVVSESTEGVSGLVGGDLSIYLNDTLLGLNTLSQQGQQTLHLDYDAGLFLPATRAGINVLRIHWDGSISCSMNLLSSVTVMPSSKISFPYGQNPDPMDLNDFPVPFIIEHPIEEQPLKIVLPFAATPAELRATMILAAGVGQISGGSMPIELVSLEEYKPSSQQNVFLVAGSSTVQTLPASLGIANLPQLAAGEGLLAFFEPQGGYGLLVTGDETGIIKAAQVAGANQVIAAGDGLNMIVSGVNPTTPTGGIEDMTLEDLGSGELVFTRPDALVQSVDFFVPAGNQIRADAAFELIISHSQQLDYLSSGLQVKVNGYPAVSLRLTDNTSNQAIFTLILPANLIHPGRNTIEFAADLNTRDLCTAPLENVAWLRISASSLLHLPLESAIGKSMLAKTFGNFPDAFLAGTGLNDITLLISTSDFGKLQGAAKLAGKLGSVLPDHTVFELKALASDSADVAQAAEGTMILVGSPSDFPSLTDKTQFPSLVFNADNTLSDQSALELVSKPEAGADVGYLAIRGFEAATSRILLAVLGNDAVGLGYAVDAVTDSALAENNFAMVTANNVHTSWLDTGIATGEITPVSTETAPETQETNPVEEFRTSMLQWVVPALAIMLAVMLLFIYFEIRHGMKRTK